VDKSSPKISLRSNLGAVVGATLGAVIFMCALGLILCLYIRRRRYKRVQRQSSDIGKGINLGSDDAYLDDSHARNGYYRHNLPEGAVVLPFVLPASTQGACLGCSLFCQGLAT
jgi:hypothetical protein